MANNWAIAIGINQYQFFQPLGYAQADAEALKDFLVTDGGFKPPQCLLMTDASPPYGERSTLPTKENILLLLEDLVAACFRPQDRLWLFFSGYGVNFNGQDYLMPLDGNPHRIVETGIEVRSLLQSLQIAALDALVVLDINRVSGTQSRAFVGQETVELAKELQIPTILSCQPEQFSYESGELSHGFFTVALLEALRFGHGSTLTNLSSYLSVRTPELCHHHWRPIQNPIVVSTSQEQIILPRFDDKKDKLIQNSKFKVQNSESPPTPVVVAAPPLEEDKSIQNYATGFKSGNPDSAVAPKFKVQNSESSPTPVRANAKAPLPLPTFHKQFLPQLLLWSATTMLLLCLIAVVFLRNKIEPTLTKVLPTSSNKSASRDPQVVEALPKAIPTPPTPAKPPTQPKSPPSPPTTSTQNESQKRNQATSDLAKMSLNPTQASDLRLAIVNARQIPPSEPMYQQAQENIEVWSRMILELAEGRAKQKLYADAIAAAQLLTPNEPLYPKAQVQMKQWRLKAKQYVSNSTLIDAAVGLIRSGQASSYNRAIEVAKKVPPNQPGFDLAKKSIDTWSETILTFAQNRASRGEYKSAIETAALVPEGTAAYKKAQEAIKKWSTLRG